MSQIPKPNVDKVYKLEVYDEKLFAELKSYRSEAGFFNPDTIWDRRMSLEDCVALKRCGPDWVRYKKWRDSQHQPSIYRGISHWTFASLRGLLTHGNDRIRLDYLSHNHRITDTYGVHREEFFWGTTFFEKALEYSRVFEDGSSNRCILAIYDPKKVVSLPKKIRIAQPHPDDFYAYTTTEGFTLTDALQAVCYLTLKPKPTLLDRHALSRECQRLMMSDQSIEAIRICDTVSKYSEDYKMNTQLGYIYWVNGEAEKTTRSYVRAALSWLATTPAQRRSMQPSEWQEYMELVGYYARFIGQYALSHPQLVQDAYDEITAFESSRSEDLKVRIPSFEEVQKQVKQDATEYQDIKRDLQATRDLIKSRE